MNWPLADVGTTHTDAGTDVPANDRADILDLKVKFNQMRAHVSSLMQTLLARTSAESARADLGIDAGLLFSSTASNALTIELRTQASASITSADPIRIKFPTSSGGFNVRAVSAALSITVPSGATLGHVSARKCAVHVYAVDVSGTVHLAVSNRYIGEAGYSESFTAIGGSSNLNSVAYTSASTGSYSYRHLGSLNFTNTTAGTWTAAASDAYRAGEYPLLVFSRSRTSALSVSNSATTITWPSADYDTLSGYDATPSAYFPTATDYYEATAFLQITGSGVADNNVTVQVRVNGLVVKTVVQRVETNEVANIFIGCKAQMGGGLGISIVAQTSTGNFITVGDGSYFQVAKIGR